MKIKIQTIVIIVLAMALLSIGGVYAYNQITEKAYQQGVSDAIILVNQQMIDALRQQNFIPYIIPINETASMQIKLVPQYYDNQLQGGGN